MEFTITVTTGSDISLYDIQYGKTVGLEYFYQTIEEFSLPKTLLPSQLEHENVCHTGSSATIFLDRVLTVIEGKCVPVDLTHLLSDPRLNTPEKFKHSSNALVFVPEGFISKYDSRCIKKMRYDEDTSSFFRKLLLSTRSPRISCVVTNNVIDWGAFVTDWASLGFPKGVEMEESSASYLEKKFRMEKSKRF